MVFQVEVPGWGVESGSGTSDTCDGCVNQIEGDLRSDKVEGAAVRLIVFLRDETCKSLEGNHGRRTPTSTCGPQPPLVDRTREGG